MEPSISDFWRSYHTQKKEAPWKTWLHEYVYADIRDASSYMKRYECFAYFCKEGLVPFVKSHGYIFSLDRNLANDIANFFFQNCKEDFVQQPFHRRFYKKIHDDIDFDHYITKGIPQEDWDLFWNQWMHMTDFYDDNFRNRYPIHILVYNRLDLEHSATTKKLTVILEDEEDQDEHYLPNQIEQASDAIGQGKDKNSLY